MFISFVVLKLRLPVHDPYLLPIIGLTTGWGLILIDRLAPNFLDRQLIWLTLAMIGLLIAAIYPNNLSILRRFRYSWLIMGLLLLGATFIFGVNPSGFGATLWLRVPLAGQVYFQPSELLKILLVIFLASYFDERGRILRLRQANRFRSWLAYLAPIGLMWGFCVLLLVWQRDLGAAVLFFSVFLALLFLALGDWRTVGVGILLMIAAALIGYFAYDVVALRIDTWINPWLEFDSRGFQIVQSLYSVASGHVLGAGIGQGSPTYVPVVHSDFAFSAISEEWGLIGALVVIGCFGILTFRGMRIASLTSRPFYLFLAAGLTLVLAIQAIMIMAGVTRILPLTGVTLPFVSYGGSSLLISCVMVGLLLNLSAKYE
jgi:cell division protein FtsW (lipid II flippase)